MKTKNYFLSTLSNTMLLFTACSNNDDAPGTHYDPLRFDKTEISIDAEMQNIVFTGDKTNCFVCHISEVIGSDKLGNHSFYYNDGVFKGSWTKISDADTLTRQISYSENDAIEGDWYKINVTENIVTVDLSENQNDKIRELILDINAGNIGKILKITQNNK